MRSDREIFLGQITFINNNSVEVEVIRKLGEIENKTKKNGKQIILIQSIGNQKQMNMIMEKVTEIGIDQIIPIVSEFSGSSLIKARKNFTHWNQIIDSARLQSRNPSPPILTKPMHIDDLPSLLKKYKYLQSSFRKLCLSSEVIERKVFSKSIIDKPENYIIAIGPEKGWSHKDLEIMKNLNFEFVTLGQNILRIETAAIAIASILRFLIKNY